MFDSRGLPDYPPPHNAWQFPPPPVSPRWMWAAIAASVLGFVAGSTLAVALIVVTSEGAPGLIDNARLISVIEGKCHQMTMKVESLTIHGTPRRQAEMIEAQNVAVEDMVHDIRDEARNLLTNDPPSEEWLADWEHLVDAREAYVREMLGGVRTHLDIPTDDRGKGIYLRMDDVFLGESTCEVPEVLLNPYPENASEA